MRTLYNNWSLRRSWEKGQRNELGSTSNIRWPGFHRGAKAQNFYIHGQLPWVEYFLATHPSTQWTCPLLINSASNAVSSMKTPTRNNLTLVPLSSSPKALTFFQLPEYLSTSLPHRWQAPLEARAGTSFHISIATCHSALYIEVTWCTRVKLN